MTTAHKGRRFEHEVRKVFEEAGYDVVRGAGSKGNFAGMKVDLIATKETGRSKGRVGVVLMQCKWASK